MAILFPVQQSLFGGRRLLALARAVLCILLLAAAADAVVRLARPWLETDKGEPELDGDRGGSARPQIPTDLVSRRASLLSAARDLFGVPESDPVPEPVQAPETRLALELRGVWVAEQPEDSLAIIKADNKERFYRTGATVGDGVTLRRVEPLRVLLYRGGHFEALSLPRESLVEAGVPVAAAPDADTGIDLARYRKRFREDRRQFASLIRLVPVRREGALEGYRLFPGLDRALFSGLGLETGDMVTAVNEIRVAEQRATERIFAVLAGAPKVRIDLLRGGRPMTLDYDLEP